MFDSEATASDWIGSRLIGADSYFNPAGFEAMTVVLDLQMKGSILATLINGADVMASFKAPAGRFRYNELIRQVAHSTGREQAFWFYIRDPDKCTSLIKWVRPCNYDHALDGFLSRFEAAPDNQGDTCRLGLVGGSGQWLLPHEHNPEDSFQITFHGSLEKCRDLHHSMGCSGEVAVGQGFGADLPRG